MLGDTKRVRTKGTKVTTSLGLVSLCVFGGLCERPFSATDAGKRAAVNANRFVQAKNGDKCGGYSRNVTQAFCPPPDGLAVVSLTCRVGLQPAHARGQNVHATNQAACLSYVSSV